MAIYQGTQLVGITLPVAGGGGSGVKNYTFQCEDCTVSLRITKADGTKLDVGQISVYGPVECVGFHLNTIDSGNWDTYRGFEVSQIAGSDGSSITVMLRGILGGGAGA
ncbi:MAG: hypothetical protein RR051_05855 [Clostridiales bacterium]